MYKCDGNDVVEYEYEGMYCTDPVQTLNITTHCQPYDTLIYRTLTCAILY